MSNATTRELLRSVGREYAREIVALTAPFIGGLLGFWATHKYAMRRLSKL